MKQQKLPVVVLVGRPNVGKSTLFNRLIGRKQAVIADYPGTTRDRLYGEVDWRAHDFLLVDTGGIGLDGTERQFQRALLKQIELAIGEADVLIFVIDGRVGITAADEIALQKIRREKKPIVLTITKSEKQETIDARGNFYALGLGEPWMVSGLSGAGTGDLLDQVVEVLPKSTLLEQTAEAADTESLAREKNLIRVAIVGRPNVGKSTLFNRLVKHDRVVVSEVPGTTHDAVDAQVEFDGRTLELVDTAGIKKRGRIEPGIEQYSVLRSLQAIRQSDVVVVLYDPVEGLTSQDMHVIGYAMDAFKSLVVAANKWDLVKLDAREAGVELTNLISHHERETKAALPFVKFAPILTISAKEGVRTDQLLREIVMVADQRHLLLTKAQLRAVLGPAILSGSSPAKRGRTLHVHRYSQIGINPPTLQFVVNDPSLVHFSYQRYLDNAIRRVYPFLGTPIRYVWELFKK